MAFAGEQNGRRVKEILESAGAASCLLCRSADQVRRLVSQQRITTVVCGYKFPDGTAEELAEDLYDTCNVLVVASQGLLDLIQNEALFRLPAPATRRELVVSVQMLLRMGERLGRLRPPRRSAGEQALIDRAKERLMARHALSEEEAYRMLRRRSMDGRLSLADTARPKWKNHSTRRTTGFPVISARALLYASS